MKATLLNLILIFNLVIGYSQEDSCIYLYENDTLSKIIINDGVYSDGGWEWGRKYEIDLNSNELSLNLIRTYMNFKYYDPGIYHASYFDFFQKKLMKQPGQYRIPND